MDLSESHIVETIMPSCVKLAGQSNQIILVAFAAELADVSERGRAVDQSFALVGSRQAVVHPHKQSGLGGGAFWARHDVSTRFESHAAGEFEAGTGDDRQRSTGKFRHLRLQ